MQVSTSAETAEKDGLHSKATKELERLQFELTQIEKVWPEGHWQREQDAIVAHLLRNLGPFTLDRDLVFRNGSRMDSTLAACWYDAHVLPIAQVVAHGA